MLTFGFGVFTQAVKHQVSTLPTASATFMLFVISSAVVLSLHLAQTLHFTLGLDFELC
jgi:hypothetical protein